MDGLPVASATFICSFEQGLGVMYRNPTYSEEGPDTIEILSTQTIN